MIHVVFPIEVDFIGVLPSPKWRARLSFLAVSISKWKDGSLVKYHSIIHDSDTLMSTKK